MVLWSVQHKEAYDKMLETGTLRTDEKHMYFGKFFLDAYLWMANQMRERVGPPPADVTFPVWAWYQWEGKRSRIDMRTHGRYGGEKGTPIVLLTIDAPDSHVLLSDFDDWHAVLNDGDLIFPDSDGKTYSTEEKQKSWGKIFDIINNYDGSVRSCPFTQATLWEIRQEWVKKAEHFLSR